MAMIATSSKTSICGFSGYDDPDYFAGSQHLSEKLFPETVNTLRHILSNTDWIRCIPCKDSGYILNSNCPYI